MKKALYLLMGKKAVDPNDDPLPMENELPEEHSCRNRREYFITGDMGWYSEKSGTIICNIEKIPELFERAARGHWGAEVNIHLDFTFQNDKNKSMAKTGQRTYNWRFYVW